LGAEEYISKPFDLDDLKQLVNELVRELARGA
jgi:DNA-binding response OmpR family regulator